MTTQSGSVTIDGPANANVAPPGWYMVFLIDDNGVPSVGQIVKVDAAADTRRRPRPASLTATAQTRRRAASNWTAVHRQRRRDRVPRAPLDHLGLHARRPPTGWRP